MYLFEDLIAFNYYSYYLKRTNGVPRVWLRREFDLYPEEQIQVSVSRYL